MSNSENKYEFSGNLKSSKFNRAMTLHTGAPIPKPCHQPNLDRSGSMKKLYELAGCSIRGKVKQLCSIFDAPKTTCDEPSSSSSARLKSVKSMCPERVPPIYSRVSPIWLAGTEDRIVVYLTSLRGIRRTYEDCYTVRMILRGFRVWVDERDVSIHRAYKRELQSVLYEKNVSLPQVFIRGKHIGGADVIKHLFEVGELGKFLKGFPVREPGILCDGCGDVRFVPCTNCSGSRKIFDEDEGLLKRCPECNENGLIRCPLCSD